MKCIAMQFQVGLKKRKSQMKQIVKKRDLQSLHLTSSSSASTEKEEDNKEESREISH